jgi:hypothetical protein
MCCPVASFIDIRFWLGVSKARRALIAMLLLLMLGRSGNHRKAEAVRTLSAYNIETNCSAFLIMLVLSDAGIAFMPTCAAAFIPNLVMLGDAPKVAAIACPPKLSGSTRRAQAQTPSSFGVQTSTMAASTPTCPQPVHPMIPIALIVAMAMRATTRLVSSIRPAMSGNGSKIAFATVTDTLPAMAQLTSQAIANRPSCAVALLAPSHAACVQRLAAA